MRHALLSGMRRDGDRGIYQPSPVLMQSCLSTGQGGGHKETTYSAEGCQRDRLSDIPAIKSRHIGIHCYGQGAGHRKVAQAMVVSERTLCLKLKHFGVS